MGNLLIGIDPDCDKSGVAIKYLFEKVFDLKELDFFELESFLEKNKEQIKEVRVEASWLIGHNWHAVKKGSAALNAEIGLRTGENHNTGKLIVGKCKQLGIQVKEVRPLKKIWKSSTGKISKAEFVALTGWKGPASQEVRDAYLLIHS